MSELLDDPADAAGLQQHHHRTLRRAAGIDRFDAPVVDYLWTGAGSGPRICSLDCGGSEGGPAIRGVAEICGTGSR